jgi:transposase-like protein
MLKRAKPVQTRNKNGQFGKLPKEKRDQALRDLANPFKSLSDIANFIGVSKASVVNLSKKSSLKRLSKEEATRVSSKRQLALRNEKRAKEIESYIRRFGIKTGRIVPPGISINHLTQYLNSKGVSPGTKKNLELLITQISKKVEKETGLPVIRRTRSSQPKRK